MPCVDDVAAFLRITDDVLNIDNVYRRVPPTTRPSPRVSPNNSTIATQTSPTVQTTSQQMQKPPRSSLLCTNCGLPGHLVDTCFKVGGGLEGKREQYMASRGRAQAHLAYLADILDGNLEGDPGPLPDLPDPVDSSIPTENVVDIPTLAALSLTPSDISPPVPTLPMDTKQINEDFLFAAYFLSPHIKSPCAFSTTLTPMPTLSDSSLLSTPLALATSAPFPYTWCRVK